MDEIYEWLKENEHHILSGNRRTLGILLNKFETLLDAKNREPVPTPEFNDLPDDETD